MNIYDDCSFCGGRVTERLLQKPCLWGERLVAVIDNVPTGVCEQCGERYYKAYILKEVEERLKNRRQAQKIELPLLAY